jgi:SP family myo-inositol transporter-like MFS transporter 13
MAIYLGCILFIAGAVLQAAAYTIVQMAIGRLVIGFGVGCGAMVLPLYVAEIAPAKARGKLIGLNNMSITGGQVISYAIGAAFASVPHGWRYMVGLGGVPAVVLGVLMPFCPESPRHLAYNGRRDEARVVLRKIYAKATEDQIDAVLLSICTACDQAREINESGSRFSKIKKLHTVPSNLRALVSACGLMVISQLSGFNALMYYSATLFSLVGFDNPTAVGLVVAGTNFIMTFVNMMVIDGMGRRKLLLSTVWGMSVGMVAIAVAFRWIPINMETMEVATTGISPAAIAVLVFIIWFVVFYGVSVGNTAWMSTDFFPLEVRAMGTMWLTCSNWGANVIISSTFLSMMKAWTTSGAFGFFAAICGLGYIWIYFFYPEVSGLVLEEVKEVFEHGFGVDYARQLRKERKDIIEERMKTQEKPIAVGH